MAEVVASIIIPVYNVENYLRECLDSIFVRQRLTHKVEIIAVNDGSTDASLSVLEEYGKRYNLNVISQQNQGPGAARNTGIKPAKGKFLLFLDSDDWYMNDKLDAVLDFLTTTDADFVDFSRQSSKSFTGRDELVNPVEEVGQILFVRQQHSKGHSSLSWDKAVRRTFLNSNNIYFPQGIYSEDEEWNIKLYAYAAKVCLWPCEFVAYRQRADSITHGHSYKAYIDCIKIIDSLDKFSSYDGLSKDFSSAVRSHVSSIYFDAVQGIKAQGVYHQELIDALDDRQYVVSYSWKKHRRFFYR